MSEVKWIKITTDIFDDEKILLIESLPDADSIIVVWFKLLCLAGKMNNSGVFVMNDTVAYTDSMLSTIFRREETTVKLALDTFEQFGMIERVNGTITIPNWGKHQTLDQLENRKKYMRNYMQDYRAKQKRLIDKSNSKVNSEPNSQSNVNYPDKDIDKDNNICSPDANECTKNTDNRESDFEKIYAIYPKKRGRTRAFSNYCSWLKGRVVNGKRKKLTNREMYIAVRNYIRQQEKSKTELEYYKNFDTLMGSQLLDYVEVEENE